MRRRLRPGAAGDGRGARSPARCSRRRSAARRCGRRRPSGSPPPPPASCVGTGIAYGSLYLHDAQYHSATANDDRNYVSGVKTKAEGFDTQWSQIEQFGAAERQNITNISGLLDYRTLWPHLIADIYKSCPTPQPEVLSGNPDTIKKIPATSASRSCSTRSRPSTTSRTSIRSSPTPTSPSTAATPTPRSRPRRRRRPRPPPAPHPRRPAVRVPDHDRRHHPQRRRRDLRL